MAAASTLFRLTGTGMVRVGPGAEAPEEAPEVEATPRDARAERAESLKALRGAGPRGRMAVRSQDVPGISAPQVLLGRMHLHPS